MSQKALGQKGTKIPRGRSGPLAKLKWIMKMQKYGATMVLPTGHYQQKQIDVAEVSMVTSIKG